MRTGIGSPTTGYFNFLTENSGQRTFQFSLDGIILSGESLPAMVSCSVIAYFQA
jgi:hypothetical protein